MSVFKAVPERYDFPAEEANIVSFWKEREIFARSLEQRAGSPTFVFYEGPPTANGMPHNGHVLTRVIKDLFPAGERQPREPQVDGQAALLLLLETVRVDARQGLHQSGLAVVDVARGADNVHV